MRQRHTRIGCILYVGICLFAISYASLVSKNVERSVPNTCRVSGGMCFVPRRKKLSALSIRFLHRAPLEGGTAVISADQGNLFPQLLESLHLQVTYNPIVVLTNDVEKTKKHITSRTARYSGLLSVVEVIHSEDPLKTILSDTRFHNLAAWLSVINCTTKVKDIINSALQTGTRRLVIALHTQLQSECQALLELSSEIERLQETGAFVSGIVAARTVATGINSIGSPLKISSLSSNRPHFGTAAVSDSDFTRIAAEMLRIPIVNGKLFKIEPGDEDCANFLRCLRMRGLSRAEEFASLFNESLESRANIEALNPIVV